MKFLLILIVCVLFVKSQTPKEAVESYINLFYNRDVNYINETYPSNGKLTQYWVFAHVNKFYLKILGLSNNS